MAIAHSIETFLNNKGIGFESVLHRHSDSSYNSATAAHIASEQLAKAVVLVDSNHRCVMAVLPANRKLVVSAINDMTYGDFELLDESELSSKFTDCEAGVAPSIGNVYGMEMIVDEELLAENTVYIEAGDHRTLLRLQGQDFLNLVMSSRHASIAGAELGQLSHQQQSYAVFA